MSDSASKKDDEVTDSASIAKEETQKKEDEKLEKKTLKKELKKDPYK